LLLFFRKEATAFANSGPGAACTDCGSMSKSFLVLFSKKDPSAIAALQHNNNRM
jgi:hypothetical protein